MLTFRITADPQSLAVFDGEVAVGMLNWHKGFIFNPILRSLSMPVMLEIWQKSEQLKSEQANHKWEKFTQNLINSDILFRNGAASFHDVVFEATKKTYSVEELKTIFNSLPMSIQATAVAHGLSDTVFNDAVFTHLRKQARNE